MFELKHFDGVFLLVGHQTVSLNQFFISKIWIQPLMHKALRVCSIIIPMELAKRKGMKIKKGKRTQVLIILQRKPIMMKVWKAMITIIIILLQNLKKMIKWRRLDKVVVAAKFIQLLMFHREIIISHWRWRQSFQAL